MDHPRLVVATVVWNHRDRLPLLLRSLEDQARRPDQTVLVDAASQDGVSAWLAKGYPHIATLRLFQHHGLSHAWRQAAKFALQRIPANEWSGAWVFFVGPEILLAKDVCERLLAAADAHPEAGALAPALLRAWYQGEDEDGLDRIEPTELIESLGFEVSRSFAWSHRGQGSSLRMFEPAPTEAFALSGGAVAVRADLLAGSLDIGALSLPWETVDALFLDLGWRLRWLGGRAFVLPEALGWRVERKGDGTALASWKEAAIRDRDRRRLIRLHLVGAGRRLATWPWRFAAALGSWPRRIWWALSRRSGTDPFRSPDARAAWKISRGALLARREVVEDTLKTLFVKPGSMPPPVAHGEQAEVEKNSPVAPNG